jgi:hypothetical protein
VVTAMARDKQHLQHLEQLRQQHPESGGACNRSDSQWQGGYLREVPQRHVWGAVHMRHGSAITLYCTFVMLAAVADGVGFYDVHVVGL